MYAAKLSSCRQWSRIAMDDTPEELDDVPQFVFTSYCYFTNTPFDE